MAQEADKRLDERYDLVEPLGEGSQGSIYRARDVRRGEDVAVKELDFQKVDAWKALELFQRECETLESLDHPQIPDYIDGFDLDEGGGATRFFLVQELVEGESLQERLDAGETMDEESVEAFLDEMLGVLDYLHAKSPPIVHRDIKPSNILCRPDGSHAVIDFGAVQTVIQDTGGGSTVVGTAGYSPPEQMMGRAVPASDLYALGATALALLSGQDPSELPAKRMSLQFREVVDISEDLAAFLDRLLAPDADDRFEDGGAALEALQTGSPAALPTPGADTTKDTALAVDDPLDALDAALTAADRRLDQRPHSEIQETPHTLSITIPAPPHRVGNFLLGPALFLGITAGVYSLEPCLLCPAIPIAGYYLGKWSKPYLRRERHELSLDADQLVIHKLKESGRGSSQLDRESFQTHRLYEPNLRLPFGRADADHSYSGRGDIFLVDADGRTATFGERLFDQNKLVTHNRAPAELAAEGRWLRDKMTAYLRYFRGEHEQNMQAALPDESTDV